MLRKSLTGVFVLLYALSIIWMVSLALTRTDPSNYVNIVMLVTGVVSGGILLFSDVCVLLRRYWSSSVVWVAMIVWLAFLIWFSWFSQSSPFIQRDFYSRDLNQLIADRRRFTIYAVVGFVILFSWYASFMLFWRYQGLHGLSISDGTEKNKGAER